MAQTFLNPSLENIPETLRLLPRWIPWNAEGLPGEKPRKIPYSAKQPHRRASSTNPDTWGTFEEATKAHQKFGYTGIGLVLNGDGLVGIDIDHCVTDGKPCQESLDLLAEIGADYIELSPSGTGLRAFGYAETLEKGCKGKLRELDVELYSNARYLTLTGHTIKQGAIAELHGFGKIAQQIRFDRHTGTEPGQALPADRKDRVAEQIRRVISGEIYHDSLRDLSASMIAQGLKAKAVITMLQGLMKNSSAEKDERWQARYRQIPELVKSAERKFPPNFQDGSFSGEVIGDSNRYKLLDGISLAALPPLQWRVKGVLPKVGLAAIYGPSTSGKSFLGFDLAAAISEGLPWFSHRVEPSNVVYAALEGEAGFKLRAQAWEKHHSRPLPAALKMLLQPFRLTTPQDVADLAEVVANGSVVFIDTLNRAAPLADENSSRDMGEILEAAKLLQLKTGGLIVLVHHTGKDTSKGARGHSSLFAALDAAIEVSRYEEVRSWKVAKSKDGEDGKVHSFTLDVEDLGLDSYDDPISSCVVVPLSSSSHPMKTPKLSQGSRTALSALENEIQVRGIAPPESLTDWLKSKCEPEVDFMTRVVTEDQWRKACFKAGITEANAEQDSKRKAFTRARVQLMSLKRIGIYEDFVWIK